MRHRSLQSTCRGITYPDPGAPKRRELCDIPLLLGGPALLAHTFASHDVGADDAPVRAAYPTGALVNELQRHCDSDGFLLFSLFSQQARPFSGSLIPPR